MAKVVVCSADFKDFEKGDVIIVYRDRDIISGAVENVPESNYIVLTVSGLTFDEMEALTASEQKYFKLLNRHPSVRAGEVAQSGRVFKLNVNRLSSGNITINQLRGRRAEKNPGRAVMKENFIRRIPKKRSERGGSGR